MSLFAKITIWFFATLIITVAAVIITTALTFTAPESRQSPFTILLTSRLYEAIHDYETRGPAGLADSLQRFQSVTGVQAILTNGKGKDLVTGQDRSDLLKQAGPGRFPFARKNRTAIARRTPDGRYWLFLLVPRPNWYGWFFQWQHVWILAVVVLLCYWFAYHITSPLRHLRRAVDRFGRGDLQSRTQVFKRRDELGQLARSFNEMADRIQTLLTAERRLLLDISHELRSPLARLIVAVELARARTTDSSTLDRIEREANRLNALVTELLDVTRAEGDPSRRKMEAVRLDDVMEQIAADTSIEANAKECRIVVTAAEPVEMHGDPELLRRAVENVVRNAVRYAPAGSAVELALRRAGERAHISVRDYGPGVPADALPHIFDAFYRVETDRDRASGGVGLGLSIARRAIELHGGTLSARNAGPGLLVTIDLPLARTEQPGETAAATPRPVQA